jgi:hypothetical protein
MTRRHEHHVVPEAVIAAEEALAKPQALPNPLSLSLVEWLRRVPECLTPLETLGEALLVRRPAERVDTGDWRLTIDMMARPTCLRRQFEIVKRIADDRDLFAKTLDPTREPWRSWQAEHAFRAWQVGERQLEKASAGPHRNKSEEATVKMLAFLQHVSTMDELITMYFSER